MMMRNSPATTGELSEHVSTKLHAYVVRKRKRQPSSFSIHGIGARGIAGIGTWKLFVRSTMFKFLKLEVV